MTAATITLCALEPAIRG
jgi:hypothetical protein